MTDSCAEYDRRAAELASRYETLAFEAVHESILDLLPPAGSRILDVGAGSGRDAAWLARHGYEVTAVEPSAGMRKEASALGRDGSIRWIDDVHLPSMGGVYAPDQMKIYTDLGIRLILSGSDFAFMMAGAKAQSAAIRGLV